jgi:carbamate kinase
MEQGQFSEGSMLPKIQAAISFLESGGRRSVITSIEAIEDAVAGRAGTEIMRE